MVTSSEEDVLTDYIDETTQSDYHDSDDEDWWDTHEEVEKVIAVYACGNRPLTGPQKVVLSVIRDFIDG